MYSNNQGDLSESSSDKDVHHESIKMKKTQKYLVESCYHRIEYITATFFVAFMWRRPLNSVGDYRNSQKTKRVTDGADT